jgi:hypothetical protein
MRMKSSKDYQVDDDVQERLSSLPGVTVYTLESALTEAIYPVFEYFLGETHCAKCAALALEREIMEALIKVFEGYAVDVPRFCEDHKS